MEPDSRLVCDTCKQKSLAYIEAEKRNSQVGDECPFIDCGGRMVEPEDHSAPIGRIVPKLKPGEMVRAGVIESARLTDS
jgi:hypothetical protein